MFVPAQANREDPTDIVKFSPPVSPPTTTAEKEDEECVSKKELSATKDGLPFLFPGE